MHSTIPLSTWLAIHMNHNTIILLLLVNMIVVVSMHILTINDKTQVQFVQTCHVMSIYTDTCIYMGVCILMLAGIKVDQAI